MARLRAFAAVCVALAPVLAQAQAQRSADFRAVAEPAAILYDAPTLRGKKLFVAPRGMPVEVVVTIEGWFKVRDRAGDMAWVERKALTDRRTVVSMAAAHVREQPADDARIVLEVGADVVLEVAEPAAPAGWVRVRHREGAAGFVRAAQVWGI